MLSVGARGSDVTRLQEQLKAAGFNPKGEDGVFGKKTRAAVLAYQRANHLTADGIIGPNTSKRLFGSGNGKYWDGKSDFTSAKSRTKKSGDGAEKAAEKKESGGAKGEKLVAAAKSIASQHKRYVWGGGHKARPGASTGSPNSKTVANDAHTKGYDCSGFVREAIYKATGKDSMSGTAATQYAKCKSISKSELKPGDLIFFGRPIHHVAIYAGKVKGVPMMYESAPSYERKGSSFGTHLQKVSYQGTPSHYGRVK